MELAVVSAVIIENDHSAPAVSAALDTCRLLLTLADQSWRFSVDVQLSLLTLVGYS